MLWMAVVGQSCENSSRQENSELPCREQHSQKLININIYREMLSCCPQIEYFAPALVAVEHSCVG